jgi:hypothetical protein
MMPENAESEILWNSRPLPSNLKPEEQPRAKTSYKFLVGTTGLTAQCNVYLTGDGARVIGDLMFSLPGHEVKPGKALELWRRSRGADQRSLGQYIEETTKAELRDNYNARKRQERRAAEQEILGATS